MKEQPNYARFKSIIKELTGQANIITIPRVFIEFTGDHIAAMLLSQIIYWSDRTSDPDGWFYKTADEWRNELCISRFQLNQALKKLKKLGVETKLKKINGAPRTNYRIDDNNLMNLFCKFLENQVSRKSRNLQMDIEETNNSDIEETNKSFNTETTTEITYKEAVVNTLVNTHAENETEKTIAVTAAAFQTEQMGIYRELFPTEALTAEQVQLINSCTDLEALRETCTFWQTKYPGHLIEKMYSRYTRIAARMRAEQGSPPPQDSLTQRIKDLETQLYAEPDSNTRQELGRTLFGLKQKQARESQFSRGYAA